MADSSTLRIGKRPIQDEDWETLAIPRQGGADTQLILQLGGRDETVGRTWPTKGRANHFCGASSPATFYLAGIFFGKIPAGSF